MEIELRNALHTNTSAMQAIVAVLAKRAAAADPGFKDEVRAALNAGTPNADEATARATREALEGLLSL